MAKCNEKCEVYSRVVGYMRPITLWNKGKQEEKKQRKDYSIGKSLSHKPKTKII